MLKKNQEEAREQLVILKQQMGVQESKITQLTEELELERIDKQMLLDATKKRIGQLEEQKELLEQNRENNEHVIMGEIFSSRNRGWHNSKKKMDWRKG